MGTYDKGDSWVVLGMVRSKLTRGSRSSIFETKLSSYNSIRSFLFHVLLMSSQLMQRRRDIIMTIKQAKKVKCNYILLHHCVETQVLLENQTCEYFCNTTAPRKKGSSGCCPKRNPGVGL